MEKLGVDYEIKEPGKTRKIAIISGAFFMLIGVFLGALGAHVLKSLISSESLDEYKTGLQYQMYHGIGLILIGLLNSKQKQRKLTAATCLMIAGIILFSGSIYLLSTINLTKLNFLLPVLGPMTPIGGLCFSGAWIFVILQGLDDNNKKKIKNNY